MAAFAFLLCGSLAKCTGAGRFSRQGRPAGPIGGTPARTAHRVEELEGMEEEELWNRVFHESSFLGHVAAWRDFSHAAARLLFGQGPAGRHTHRPKNLSFCGAMAPF